MPRRVVDGVVAETLCRDIWCLTAASLRRAGLLDELVRVLTGRGRTVVLLGADSPTAGAAAPGASRAEAGASQAEAGASQAEAGASQAEAGASQAEAGASVAEACARHGRTAADAVLVCADLLADTEAFAPDGARVIVVGPRVRPVRGVLAVPGAGELDELFDRRVSYQAASTYHEV